MLNIKKVFNLKIVSLALIGFFILNSAVYGIDLPAKSLLRTNLLSSTEEGQQRLKDGLAAFTLDLEGLTQEQHSLLDRALGTFFVGLNTVRSDIKVLTEKEMVRIDPEYDLRRVENLKVYKFTKDQLRNALENVGASRKNIEDIIENIVSHPGRFNDKKGHPQAVNLFILDEYYALFAALDRDLKIQWAAHTRYHLENLNLSETEAQAVYPLSEVARILTERISFNKAIKEELKSLVFSPEKVKAILDVDYANQIRILREQYEAIVNSPSIKISSFFVTVDTRVKRYKISSLIPTQPYLFQTKIDGEAAKKEMCKMLGLHFRNIPIIVVDFGEDMGLRRYFFIGDGNHRIYTALSNNEESIDAFTIKFEYQSDDKDAAPMKAIENYWKTLNEKAESMPQDGNISVLEHCTEWRYLFFNLRCPSVAVREKLIRDVPYLSKLDAGIFLGEARKVILGKDPLWDESYLVRAIAELPLQNENARIPVSKDVFNQVKKNPKVVTADSKEIKLKSGIVLVLDKTRGFQVTKPVTNIKNNRTSL